MAITLKERLNIGDATANPWGGIGSQLDKKPFEKDIAGGGYTGLPFIKPVVPKTLGQYFSLTTEALSLDYPIRGGSYEELAARQDFARIDRFIEFRPQGPAFVDKQTGLALSNPKIETGYNGGVGGIFGVENTRLYSVSALGGPPNLLTQLTAGGTGFHYPNLGVGQDLLDPLNLYAYNVATKDTNENRLVSLYNLNLNGEGAPLSQTALRLGLTNSTNNTIGSDTNVLEELLGISLTGLGSPNSPPDVLLQRYPGGPGSRYGIGETLIYRSTNAAGAPIATKDAPLFVGPFTNDIKGNNVQGRPNISLDYNDFVGLSLIQQLNNDFQNNISTTLGQEKGDGYIRAEQGTAGPTTEGLTFGYTMGYDKLLEQNDDFPLSTTKFEDFRNKVIRPGLVAKNNYRKFNKVTRIQTGDPGSPLLDRTNINNRAPNGETQDLANLAPIGKKVRDLIKFRFGVIENASGVTTNISFRAFLTGYNDNHQAQWDSKKYAGRGENFYTYQGHDRMVTFNFKIAAQSKYEMAPLYKKFNYLVSTLYPDYTDSGFMRGNIIKLTIGDLFVDEPGILTSLNITVNDNYPWEIAMDEPETNDVGEVGGSSDMLEVPQIFDVAVSFKPILNVLPTKGVKSPIFLTTPNNRFFETERGVRAVATLPEQGATIQPAGVAPIPVQGPTAPTDIGLPLRGIRPDLLNSQPTPDYYKTGEGTTIEDLISNIINNG
jgi:hypothetical protein